MSNITNFSEGASILQQVDVSDIFKNLALGIADAQQKLDDNSVAQVIRLSQTQINGVSLLQLGFAPVFYAFQYADISASINLKMAMKESLEFGFGIDLKLSNQKGYTSSDQQFLSKDSYSETKEEYKASRDLNFKANEKNNVKIENKYFKQREDLESKSRLEQFKEDIVAETSVEHIFEEVETHTLSHNESRGIDVWIDRGFLRIEPGIHFNKTGVGVLRIQDYSNNKSINVDGSSNIFTLDGDLETTMPDAETANSGTVYGVSKTGDFWELESGNWVPISSKIYFQYNKDAITYTDNLKDGPDDGTPLTHAHPAGSADNKNHTIHALIHQALRLIQTNDPDARITITGVTDPKGGKSGANMSLAKRRAENVANHIFGSAAPVNVTTSIINNASGNSDLLQRYAQIELNADYIIFIGGNINLDATPEKSSSSKNKFVYLDADPAGFKTLSVKYGSYTLNYTASSLFSDIIDYTKGVLEKDSYDEREDRHYFLNDEAIVKFHLYTYESEDIAIEHDDEESSSESSSENTFLSSQTRNKQSELNNAISSNSQSNSFALGANVDFRMAKQFEMSMEGNASMSARLVAVPAPEAFTEFIQNTYNPQQSGQ